MNLPKVKDLKRISAVFLIPNCLDRSQLMMIKFIIETYSRKFGDALVLTSVPDIRLELENIHTTFASDSFFKDDSFFGKQKKIDFVKKHIESISAQLIFSFSSETDFLAYESGIRSIVMSDNDSIKISKSYTKKICENAYRLVASSFSQLTSYTSKYSISSKKISTLLPCANINETQLMRQNTSQITSFLEQTNIDLKSSIVLFIARTANDLSLFKKAALSFNRKKGDFNFVLLANSKSMRILATRVIKKYESIKLFCSEMDGIEKWLCVADIVFFLDPDPNPICIDCLVWNEVSKAPLIAIKSQSNLELFNEKHVEFVEDDSFFEIERVLEKVQNHHKEKMELDQAEMHNNCVSFLNSVTFLL